MCGICGFYTKKEISKEVLNKMNNELSHRGPNDAGEEIYTIKDWNIGFAHRRLSILDLSKNGHQPMNSTDRRISIIFNGEIYNFLDLKKQLEGYNFVSNTDTEVIIAAYLKWGIDFVSRLNGMFSIALLDKKTEELFLIRDRVGKKPLFYFHSENEVVWASELKSILQYPFFERRIDATQVSMYMSKQFICSPNSIYKDVYKVEPGMIIRIQRGNIEKIKYWDISQKYNQLKSTCDYSYDEAKNRFEEMLVESVSRRLISDVPVGAFLSSGYDSTLICALAQKQLSKPIKTYSIGFENKSIDESENAKIISNILGTSHTNYILNKSDFINLIDDIPRYYDEPFADNSQISTMIVSELARREVTVVLSGDGGDELFGGYDWHRKMLEVQTLYAGLSEQEREELKNDPVESIAKSVMFATNDKIRTQAGPQKSLGILSELLGDNYRGVYYEIEDKYRENNWAQRRMLLDAETFMIDGVLAKVDRATMRYGLECRCPLLDMNIIEFSFRIPLEYKLDMKNSKKIIKDLVHEHVPNTVMERPKLGFGIPVHEWMNESKIKEQILEYSSENYLRNQGIFDEKITNNWVTDYFTSFGKPKSNRYNMLMWRYFIFQQWYNYYM